MTRLVASALAAFLLATPALAQDRAPFTGLRVEGLAGWDRVQGSGGHDDAFTYGAGVGYDVQMGGALVGVDAEASDSKNKACDGGTRTVGDPRLCLKAARDLYAGARIGTVIGGRTLLYAKAGYTNFRSKFTSDDGTSETTLSKGDLDGIRVGAGAEYSLAPNMFVKAEYRYSNYEQGVERHQVLGGVGVRF